MGMWWLWVVGGYLCGSIPFGLLLGKAKGIDIRQAGSGTIGATNLTRLLGRPWGVLCFVLDVLKGAVPVVAAGASMGLLGEGDVPAADAWVWLAVGAAAVLGHVFPVWLKFKGGKGVATGVGVLAGFWPTLTLPGLCAFGTWVVLVSIFRYVSFASMIAAVSLPGFLFALALLRGAEHAQLLPFYVVSALLVLLVVMRHRSNIARLLAGTESKIGDSKVSSHQGS